MSRYTYVSCLLSTLHRKWYMKLSHINRNGTLTFFIGLPSGSQTRLAESRAALTTSFQPEFRTLKLISCQVIWWHNHYSLLYLYKIKIEVSCLIIMILWCNSFKLSNGALNTICFFSLKYTICFRFWQNLIKLILNELI